MQIERTLLFDLFSASVFASLPRTTRGQPIVLGADPKGKTFLYTNGNSVFIRSLDVSSSMTIEPSDLFSILIQDASKCEVYTEHSTAVQCAKYSPSGSYIASAGQSFLSHSLSH